MNLRDQLQAIYEAHGKLTPEILVAEARPKDHPLHARVFERPAPEAAEAWYRHCAHELIQSVRVVYAEGTDKKAPKEIRYFHAVREETGYVYEPAEEVVADEVKLQIVLRDMEREWMTLERRYGHFKEFAEMIRSALVPA